MSKNPNYSKHQRSKYKSFVATTVDGKRIQANSQKELSALLEDHKLDLMVKEAGRR